MDQIGRFLKRFANFEIPEKAILRASAKVISTTLGIDIEIKDLAFNSGVLSVRGNSMLRSEVMRKKGDILHGITEELGKASVRDIV